MREFFLTLAVILSFSCSSLPPVKELPGLADEAADKLEQALDVADQAIGPSKYSALMVCQTYGMDTPICAKIQNQIADVEERVSQARDVVEAYRRAEKSFEEANAAVNEALAAIEALSDAATSN